MGYLAHVCTTYKVTHGDGRFNHCCGELSRFLNEYEYEDPERTADGTPLPNAVLEKFNKERLWSRIGNNNEIESKLWRIEDIKRNCDKFSSLMAELHSIND